MGRRNRHWNDAHEQTFPSTGRNPFPAKAAVIAWERFHCQGQIHAVGVTKRGRLIFTHHTAAELANEILVTDLGGNCRCAKFLAEWRIRDEHRHGSDSPVWVERSQGDKAEKDAMRAVRRHAKSYKPLDPHPASTSGNQLLVNCKLELHRRGWTEVDDASRNTTLVDASHTPLIQLERCDRRAIGGTDKGASQWESINVWKFLRTAFNKANPNVNERRIVYLAEGWLIYAKLQHRKHLNKEAFVDKSKEQLKAAEVETASLFEVRQVELVEAKWRHVLTLRAPAMKLTMEAAQLLRKELDARIGDIYARYARASTVRFAKQEECRREVVRHTSENENESDESTGNSDSSFVLR